MTPYSKSLTTLPTLGVHQGALGATGKVEEAAALLQPYDNPRSPLQVMIVCSRTHPSLSSHSPYLITTPYCRTKNVQMLRSWSTNRTLICVNLFS